MKIALIGTRGVPAHYGGFETAVEEVGARLVEAGHQVVVFCRGEGPDEHRGMQLVHLPALPKRSLETLSHTALSVVHKALIGTDAAILFNAANSPFLPLLRARRIPVATHVDGLEWRRSKWGPAGRRYYRIAESLAVRWSDALIADAAGIADYYRAEFGAATALIAYGAPQVAPGSDRLAEVDLRPDGYYLAVARFEPENHVLEIVKGYVASAAERPLVVVGSAPYSDAYTAAVEAAADSRVRLLGGVWDQELLDQLYAGAHAYLHGHSVGGTNPSLLRAVGAGTATIAFDSVFNREVLGVVGDYFTGPDDLAALLAGYRPRTEGLAEVAARYDWDQVAAGYEQLCTDLAAGRRSSASGRRNRPGWSEGEPDAVLVAHPSAELYGSDRVLLESVSGLIEDGRQVTVALPGPGPLEQELIERGAQVVHCSTPVLRKSALSPLGLVRLAGQALAGLGSARRLAAGKRLVYVNTLTVPLWLVAGRLAGVPVICHVHEAEQSAAPLVRRGLVRAAAAGQPADRELRIQPPGDRRHVAAAGSTHSGRLQRRPRGPAAVTAPRPEPRPARLLFLGRLSARKGPQVAIEAARAAAGAGRGRPALPVGGGLRRLRVVRRQAPGPLRRAGPGRGVAGFPAVGVGVGGRLRHRAGALHSGRAVRQHRSRGHAGPAAAGGVADLGPAGRPRPATPTRASSLPDDPAALADAVEELLAAWPQVRDTISSDREAAIRRPRPGALPPSHRGLVSPQPRGEPVSQPTWRQLRRDLATAQKSNRNAPAYSRWVNRPLGRIFAATAFKLGLTPNQVTAISAVFTFAGIGVLATGTPSWWLGVLVAALLVLGYALDSADGQLARLRGGGQPGRGVARPRGGRHQAGHLPPGGCGLLVPQP